MTIDLKKAELIVGLCGILGLAIGSVFYGLTDNYIYSASGLFIGITLGHVIDILMGRKINIKTVTSISNKLEFVAAISNLFMAAACIVFYILAKDILGIAGALFFGICGIYLLRKHRKEKDRVFRGQDTSLLS